MAVQTTSYPVQYQIEEPESLSRWLWLFKWLLLIPHAIVLWVLSMVAAVTLFIAWVIVVITAKYPRGLFNFIVGAYRWSARYNAYAYHMTDDYPPFSMGEEPQYPARVYAEYPQKLSRLKAFFRLLLVIPHLIIIWALSYVLGLLVLVHIVVVIITGKPQEEIFRIMAGINRWSARVFLYVALTTDDYPPFSLD